MSRLLVLGTADWNQAIATNQHTMVRELAREYPLIYTESMGLRQPELKMRDVKRIARRLKRDRVADAATKRAIPAGVEVRSPRVIPRHVGVAAKLNRPAVHRLVSDWIAQPSPRILWTYTPVTYGLEDIADAAVYHCVDLLGTVDGIDNELVERSERRLAAAGVQAVGSSEVVVEHLERMGFKDVLHWPNVADTEVFDAARPAVLERQPGRAVFAGNLSTWKVDFELLGALVDAGIDLHLAGPVAEGGGSADDELRTLVGKGATYHGMLSLPELAELYWTAEVGVIPYSINEYTRGVNPLKTYEYLATGLGVVSTPVPAVVARPGHVEVESTREGFVEAVHRQLATPASDERISIAHGNSWVGRGAEARRLIATLQPA
ncbi:glycosyltransferase [Nocardioides sp.]|uniref:glycosyltransferase n=1 Tax=Nocardioides sp. TaxID=35761 RepID=UPI003512C7D0